MHESTASGENQNHDLVRLQEHLKQLAAIGIALSAEQNLPLLLEKIVDEARSFARADAGTLYLIDDGERQLEFAIIQNSTMQTRMGGSAGPITWTPVPLYIDSQPNHANVSSHTALSGEIINIPDVYEAEGFDFSGTRKFDEGTGYHSQSMLVIPMRNKEGEIIGVLQLINALDEAGRPIPFPPREVDLIASLASQAAVAITNVRLYRDLENLLDAFIKTIATAIDEKSPYTAGHIRRVQALTMDIARAMNEDKEYFPDFRLNDDEMRELSIAAWLHDIGKIVTPEHVVDKSTKLETIFDRIHLIKARYEIHKRDLRIKTLEAALAAGNRDGTASGDGPAGTRPAGATAAGSAVGPGTDSAPDSGVDPAVDSGVDPAVDSAGDPGSDATFDAAVDAGAAATFAAAASAASELARIEEEENFISQCNQPGEFMDDDKIALLQEIATRPRPAGNNDETWLSTDELDNLSIRKGSLTAAERAIIENHSTVTHKMLSQLPFPKKMRQVPDYAAAHHEKLDGSGYPRHLKGEEISRPARIIAIADIFEALTAPDRPYKKPMPLSQALKILNFMKKDGHIDSDILELFIQRGVYRDYAERELDVSQLDC